MSIQSPWGTGYWLDTTFTYTQEQQRAILEALPVNTEGDALVQFVHDLARDYLGAAKHRDSRPSLRDIKGQLKPLQKAIETLLDQLQGLHGPTVHLLNHTAVNTSLTFRALHSQVEELLWLMSTHVKIAQDDRHSIPKGAPPKLLKPLFVKRLYKLWIRCGNSIPKRSYNAYEGQDDGPFHRFVRACVIPIGEGEEKGTDDIIRAILDMGKNKGSKC